MEVIAIGCLEDTQDSNSKHWRIYLESQTDGEYILALYESKGQITEAILLKQIGTVVPTTEAQMKQITSNIGFQTLQLEGGQEYNREWGDQWTEKMEFADNEFKEKFVSNEEIVEYWNNYILYSREIETGETEWLFVGLEEGEKFGEIAFQVGFSVNLADITIL
jgi:hypothetical protein